MGFKSAARQIAAPLLATKQFLSQGVDYVNHITKNISSPDSETVSRIRIAFQMQLTSNTQPRQIVRWITATHLTSGGESIREVPYRKRNSRNPGPKVITRSGRMGEPTILHSDWNTATASLAAVNYSGTPFAVSSVLSTLKARNRELPFTSY